MLSGETTAAGRPAVWCGLIAAGLASLGGYCWLAFGLATGNSWPLLHAFMATLGAVSLLHCFAWRLALRLPEGRRLGLILFGFAVAFRLIMLFAGLGSPPGEALARDLAARDMGGDEAGYEKFQLYDNDVWRFLWDGHVTTHATSPYRYAPAEIEADAELEARFLPDDRWWDVYDNVSFERLVTVYPPLAQILFALTAAVAPGSVLVWKATVVACDLGLCWLLWRLLRRAGGAGGHSVLYAWSPLAIKEVAGSGHFESLTALLLLAGTGWALSGRHRSAVVAATAAALTKLAPVVALPLVLRRTGWRHAGWGFGLAVVLCLPFTTTLPRWFETVRIFAERWQFNAGPWALLEAGLRRLAGDAAPTLATLVAAGLLAATVVLAWRRLHRHSVAPVLYGGVYAALAVATLLAPAVMPWYLLWALPFAVLVTGLGRSPTARRLGALWPLLCCLSFLSYYFYAEQAEFAWWRWIEYGTPAALAVATLAAARGARAPRGPRTPQSAAPPPH